MQENWPSASTWQQFKMDSYLSASSSCVCVSVCVHACTSVSVRTSLRAKAWECTSQRWAGVDRGCCSRARRSVLFCICDASWCWGMMWCSLSTPACTERAAGYLPGEAAGALMMMMIKMKLKISPYLCFTSLLHLSRNVLLGWKTLFDLLVRFQKIQSFKIHNQLSLSQTLAS